VQPKAETTINWATFAQTRAELGGGFVRILGYFREDGAKSVSDIEGALRSGSAAPLILPAHKLKSEAREFGALELAELAEHIEIQARDCIEWHLDTGALVEHVVTLRPLFEATIEALDAASNPLKQRDR
jgi:histidine phosphotransfer protein HptB